MKFYNDITIDIIEQCKTGNTRAQQKLYQLYSKAMYNVCYRMMNNREEAEDMLQDSFTEAFSNLAAFRFESTFGVWLKRITVNKCINNLKKRKVDFISLHNIPDPVVSDKFENEEASDTKTLSVDLVQKAIEKLPEGYRVVFSLYLIEGYDHDEIAHILGISKSTSKSQYSRAKQRIREILIDQQDGRQA